MVLVNGGKWKSVLLSSGLPLQSEAGGMLVSKGFVVGPDFKYASGRHPGKDASVDLHATGHTPFSDPERVTGHLELLVECRQGNPDEVWAFLPDPNKPGLSPIIAGRTIRVFDRFSPYAVEPDATVAFDADATRCLKGFAMNGGTHPTEEGPLERAVTRLQFALPRLLVTKVLSNLGGPADRNVPFLFCPILLTGAPLLVFNEGVTVEHTHLSDSIGEFTVEVPYLVLYSDYGPDFESHCAGECAGLKMLHGLEEVMLIEQKRARHEQSATHLPFTLIESLMKADDYHLHELFTHFVVCSRTHFSPCVDAIKKTAAAALRTPRQLV